jgi:hypothetical protein
MRIERRQFAALVVIVDHFFDGLRLPSCMYEAASGSADWAL